MDISKCKQLFSIPRVGKYLAACKADEARAVELYQINIQLSQAFYPLLSVLEVALRNAIDNALATHFADPLWLINKRNQFANHPDLVYIDKMGNKKADHFFTDKIKSAQDKLNFRGVPVSHVKLLAELTFGFWIKFFDKKSVKILKGAQIRAFAKSPGMAMTLVHSHLNKMVALRNRISHNEPICFNKSGDICLLTISGYEADINNALGWIEADLKAWSNEFNTVAPLIIKLQELVAKNVAQPVVVI